MKTNTTKLTFSAVLAAVVAAAVYITSLINTMQLADAVISTFAVMLTNKTCGRKFAATHYATVSVLLFILLPNKFFAFLYTTFFGLYAIIKLFIEQRNNIKTEWVLKLLYYAVISLLIIFGFNFFIAEGVTAPGYLYIIIYLILVAVMALYDIFLSFFGSQLFRLADKYLKNIK